jgi:hypothetical protein
MTSNPRPELLWQLPLPPRSPSWRQEILLNCISKSYQMEVKRLNALPPDETQNSVQGESSKSAHSRRREQVRRAQRSILPCSPVHLDADENDRKHRERKETYIKSLEQQVVHLLNQRATAIDEKRVVDAENAMLRGLLEQHGISIPTDAAGFGPAAQVSFLDTDGGQQRLQVTMPEVSPDFLADFDASQSSAPLDSTSPDSIDVDPPAQLNSNHASSSHPPGHPFPPSTFPTMLPAQSVQILPPSSEETQLTRKSLPPLPSGTSHQQLPHPAGLDAAQIGIDFVLALENPCLPHTQIEFQSEQPSGHILTTQAPLLAHAPHSIEPASSWTIPAVEIEQLLNLSSQLNLAGELTPVQAWSRVRSSPNFVKLNLKQLEVLKEALLKEVQCYG